MSKSLVLTDKLTIVKQGRENKWIKVETVVRENGSLLQESRYKISSSKMIPKLLGNKMLGCLFNK